MPRGYPGSTPAVDPRSQGMIPRRFKRKKIFVTDGHRTDGRTDRRDSRNSYVDYYVITRKYTVLYRYYAGRSTNRVVLILLSLKYT